MATESSQIEPKIKSRRFYIILAATFLLIVSLAVVVVFELSISAQNNYGPGPVDIEVIPDKLFYLQGEEAQFSVYVDNPNDWPVPRPYHVSYKIKENDHIVDDTVMFAEPPPGPPQTYPAHSRTFSGTYSWNQKTYLNKTSPLVQVQPGNYTFTVTFGGLVEYGSGGNCTFEIRPNP